MHAARLVAALVASLCASPQDPPTVPLKPNPGIELSLADGAKRGQTVARVSRDDEHLLVSLRARLNGAPAKGEQITLRVSPSGDDNLHYLFTVTPDGKVQTMYREENPPWWDISWAPKIEAMARMGEKEWTAELAIPFSCFTLSRQMQTTIGFGITRIDATNGETHAWRGKLQGLSLLTYPRAEPESEPVPLGAGSAHPGTTGEVRLELDRFMLEDPHARGHIWDLAVNPRNGELYVLSVPRFRNPPEIQVFDRHGKYLRLVMPFNPTLPRNRVADLVQGTRVEGNQTLLSPKRWEIFGAVETSLYGEWWHFPQKMIFAPDGDLLLTNLFRGTLWRLHPDGSLPAEGWTSIQNPARNEPFEKTVDLGIKHFGRLNFSEEWYASRTENYLPFPELFYPYLAFDPEGRLVISRGLYAKTSGLDAMAQFCRYWEVPRGNERQLPDTTAVWWTMKLRGGATVDDMRGYDFDGREAPLPPPGGVPGRKEAGSFVGDCGLAFDGDHLILSDRAGGRLLVFDPSRRLVATLTGYTSPTALAVDHGNLLVLVGKDKKKELLKLKSWRDPELLARSAPLHTEALQVAVDGQTTPPIVWVANGDGPGSLVKLSGADLSLQGKWGDDGTALSSPVQQGYVPILNIDPETGRLFFEDDSHFRFGKRGDTFGVDPDGANLKKMTGDLKEMPRLETLFGADGRLYWWEKGKIWRYDRSGKPLPFKATGSDVLAVDEKSHHVGVYMGLDVDKNGMIYVVNAKSQLDVFDADGNLYRKGLIDLRGAVRGIQVDRDGSIYTLSRQPANLVQDRILQVYDAPLLRLSKYGPDGGSPIWSVPWTGITGRDQVLVAGCGCLRPRLHQAMDDKGYLFVANWNSVRILDRKTGKTVGEFGSYGNMDCRGKESAFPHPELPFGTISALAVWKDQLFAIDQLNRRIVKCRIVYR